MRTTVVIRHRHGSDATEERKKRVMRRTPAEDEPPPTPLNRNNDDEDDDSLLSGEPTMEEMELVLSKDAYDKYVKDWDRGKASRRMDYAVRRGYIISAKEKVQQELDHKSALEAQNLQRRKSAAEFRVLKTLVKHEEANAAQTERYQTRKDARTAADRKARAREAKAIEEAEVGMAALKRLIDTGDATKAEQKIYAQLEGFGAQLNGPDQDKVHPLQMSGHPLLHKLESSLRKGFRSLRQTELQTLSWLQSLRRYSPEAALARPELVFPD
ncbi:MAG: hypothetical protein M1826_003167 [Phylliscum demangeonii]|nr:MAG: hypothetical protein M1826_003167 [Phylliscum demangeonii]